MRQHVLKLLDLYQNKSNNVWWAPESIRSFQDLHSHTVNLRHHWESTPKHTCTHTYTDRHMPTHTENAHNTHTLTVSTTCEPVRMIQWDYNITWCSLLHQTLRNLDHPVFPTLLYWQWHLYQECPQLFARISYTINSTRKLPKRRFLFCLTLLLS